MFGTYKKEDVEILLKDITKMVKPSDTKVREEKIQSGVHYCEMLPYEYVPTERYMKIYEDALQRNASKTAMAVGNVAEQIWNEKGIDTVLISLARAGTPIGILIKRYLQQKYHVTIPHYTISIIRGRGIDHNAMRYILSKHAPNTLQFVDGWTGKGAIRMVLQKALEEYPDVKPDLAVLSDPAYAAEKFGTHEDFLIASSCLNATVSGLLSRTFLRSDIIGESDFHGAVFYKELIPFDRTYEFIHMIESQFSFSFNSNSILSNTETELSYAGWKETEIIQQKFGIHSIHLVKPSIGETTRVLLRRIPWKILIAEKVDDADLQHIYQLAKERDVAVEKHPLKQYKACGLIKEISGAL